MRWLFLLVLPTVVFAGCFSDNEGEARNETDIDASEALNAGQRKFSLEALRTLNEARKGQNIFFSPHSIYQSLLLAYFTAANDTEKAIQKALYLPETQSKAETLQTFGMENYLQGLREVNGSTDYSYKTANKMFIASNIKIKECVGSALSHELESVDFAADSVGALEHINGWVANITQGHIKNLIPPSGIHEQTKLVLANAAYFKGLWKSKFLREQTEKNALFYMNTSKIRHVDMMSQKGTFNHLQSERLQAHILELPYKGGDVSMIIILPRYADNTINDLIATLSDDVLQEILDFQDFYPRPIEVQIPKFIQEEELDLKTLFGDLGLSEVFNNGSDFSALTGTDEGIRFDDAVHKARVEIDEEGTEAAAATAIFSFRSSRPLDPTTFRANHPFAYMIYDKVSRNILFMGVYRVPAKKQFPKKLRFRS